MAIFNINPKSQCPITSFGGGVAVDSSSAPASR